MLKSISVDDSPSKGLAKALKSSKTKRDLEFLLNSQEKQKFIFETSDEIKEKEEKEEKEEK